jgi:drug/metabolite transporter (DMT)-like permease
MSPFLLWIVFTVSAIFGMVGYDVVIKLASEKINVFVFTTLLTLAAFAAHFGVSAVYRSFNPELSLKVSSATIGLAVLGGIAFMIMNIGFFMGVKYGGLVRTNTLWLVGGLILTAIVGVLAFEEELTLAKIGGIILGIGSIYLLASE